jgi:hypothetical protein
MHRKGWQVGRKLANEARMECNRNHGAKVQGRTGCDHWADI